ncbi:protein roadkill [Nasonia vitripennis]|uniref:Roadkill n=1 Tax=Nasonia vitripennis TaxID=7425 RepID=A0A7M7QM25_NASVI|nr:protein roadkill [Nasonia vitripennis]XP_031788680.1 protein roadkill [Nasonia vitripennis]XP_031788681.1 protein roadkill [Nasonia vitripennis]
MDSLKSTLSDRGEVIETNSKFKWNIAHFPDYCACSGERLLSPIFSSGSNAEYKWRMELYPFNYHYADRDYLSLYILSENDFAVAASYELSVLDEYSSTLNKRVTNNQKFSKINESWGFHKYIAREDVSKVLEKLADDTLTILLELSSVYVPDRRAKIPGNYTISSAVQRKILLNYERLLTDELYCDVTLISAEGKELHAHKAVLSAGSEYFASMFKHDMIEKQENLVTIEDMDHDTIKELLRFIYAGKVENLEKLAKSLYLAADRCGIEELMNLCSDYFCRTLSLSNAVDYLSFGYLYNIELLKNTAKKYIVGNAKHFVDQPEFNSLNNQHTEIIFSLFQELVAQTK